ncbi:hypothetical protein ABPG73_022894 [Tetrahymena malaccensis]
MQHNLIQAEYGISLKLKDSYSESETIQDISQEFKNDIVLPSLQTKKFGSCCESNLLSNIQNNQQSNQQKKQNKLLFDQESNNTFLASKNQENKNKIMNLQSLKKSQIQFSQSLRNEKSYIQYQRKSPSLQKKQNYAINIKIDDKEIQSQKSQILSQAISQKLKSLQSASIRQKIQNVIFKCKRYPKNNLKSKIAY